MNTGNIILGIDVSKAKLDACLRLPQPGTLTVPNTPAGPAQLLARAAPAGPLHLLPRSQRRLRLPGARQAHAAGHTVSILPPLAVHR